MKFDIAFLKKYINNPLFSTLLISGLTLFSAVFSYVLQFFLSINLSIEEFGVFSGLLSLMSVLGFVLVFLNNVLVKRVAELDSESNIDRISAIYFFLKKVLFIAFIVVAVFSYLFKQNLSSWLGISSQNVFIPFGLLFGFSFISMLPQVFFQGLRKFYIYSLYANFASFLRLLLPVILVINGYGVLGVFTGMLLAGILVFSVGDLILKRDLKNKKANVAEELLHLLKESVPILLFNLFLTMFVNIDMVFAKRIMGEHSAGVYAGAVTLGKILLFGLGVLSTFMYPKISYLRTRPELYIKEIKLFLTLLIIGSLAGLLIFWFFPQYLNVIFFRGRFDEAVTFLPLYSLFIVLYVFVQFFALLNLALNRLNVYLLMIPGVLLQVIGVLFFANSYLSLIKVNLASVTITLILLLILTAKKNVSINNNTSL